MTTFIICCLAAYWVWCYIKYRRNCNMDKVLLAFLQEQYAMNPSDRNAAELAAGLMKCQRYKDAYEVYEDLKNSGYRSDCIDGNMEFCKKPHPFTSGLKNHNFSYWHNFILVRLGGRRCVDISSETYLKVNAILRQMDRR